MSKRMRKTCIYYKKNDFLLTSYWDKGNKPVLLLSTMHSEPPNAITGNKNITGFMILYEIGCVIFCSGYIASILVSVHLF